MILGQFPSRRSHLALEHYRKSQEKLYACGGLLPTNGPEWSRLRMPAQKPLTMKLLTKHIQSMDEASREFVGILEEKEEINDILEELKKYFLEVTSLVVFGQPLGAIKKDLEKDSVSAKLMKAAFDTNSEILETDNGLR